MKYLKGIILVLFVSVALISSTSAANIADNKKDTNKELLENFKNKMKKDNTLDFLKKGESVNLVIYGKINSDNVFKIDKINGDSDIIKNYLMSNYNENPIHEPSALSGKKIVFVLKLAKY